MPRQETSRFRFSQGWLRGEDWWGDPVSANFILLDVMLGTVIESMTERAPPSAADVVVGDMFIVADNATDAWEGHEGQIAALTMAGWRFVTPVDGVRARLKSPAGWIWFNGEKWLREDQNDDTPIPILGTRYDVALSVGYEAEAGETLLVVAIPEPMTLPAAAVGSWGRCVTPPNGIVRLIIRRNGSDVGTITFAANSARATFAVQSDRSFAAGDLLTIHVPDNPPAGFANYGATLRFILPKNGGN